MSNNCQKNMGDLLGKEMKISEEHHFTWKVKNFAKVRESKEALQAQRLEFKMGSGVYLPTEWFIRLDKFDEIYKRKNRLGVGVYIGLVKKPDEANEVNISYRFKVKRNNKKEFHFDPKKCVSKNMGMNSSSTWGMEVIYSWMKNDYLPIMDDGSLNFEIHIKLYASKTTTLDKSQHFQLFHGKSTKKLQTEMANMLLESWSCPHADSPTKIICKDGVELAVNRGILSARSPVFFRMFQADMKEAKTGVVEVKEISSISMRLLLHFLYTGVLQDNWSSPGIVEELVYAAGKYEQDDLVEFLDPLLVTICTEENVGILMNLARKLNMIEAEKDLFQFIIEHGITYEKLESMVKDGITADWNQVSVDVDGTSSGENCDHDDNVVNEPVDFPLLKL